MKKIVQYKELHLASRPPFDPMKLVKLSESFALILAFQPYIGMPWLLPSDIQPLAFISCLVLLGLTNNRPIISKQARIVFYVLVLNAALALLLAVNSEYDLSLLFRELFALISPPIYFISYVCLCNNLTSKQFSMAASAFVVIYFAGAFLNAIGASELIKLFVNRSVFVEFAARGFTSFFPEPSRIAEQSLGIFVLSISLRFSLKPILSFLLLSATILAGSGQTVIVYFELLSAAAIGYWTTILRVLKVRFQLLRISFALLFVPLLAFVAGLIFFLSNQTTRGFRAVQSIFNNGLYYVSTDAGIQVKLTGAVAAISSFLAFEPDVRFPFSGLESRPGVMFLYNGIFLNLFGVNRPPLLNDIYTSLGQYPILFGIFGSFSVLIILWQIVSSTFSRARISRIGRGSSVFVLLATLFSIFLKVPAANPINWLLIASILTLTPAVASSDSP